MRYFSIIRYLPSMMKDFLPTEKAMTYTTPEEKEKH